MNIAGVQWPVFNPYGTATVEIYVSGCTRKCDGCHNPELHDFNYGDPLDIEKLVSYLKERKYLFDVISIVGGDLLCQDQKEALAFMGTLVSNFNTKDFWLFTGADKEECPYWVFKLFQVIKVGKFDKQVYNSNREAFPVTTNQKVLKQGEDY